MDDWGRLVESLIEGHAECHKIGRERSGVHLRDAALRLFLAGEGWGNMRYIVGLLLACICGFNGASVLAAMIEANDPRYGTGNNITIDTKNRLEWLDWSVTAGRKQWYDIQPLLKPGGPYEGWRWASDSDVTKLLVALGLPTPGLDQSAPVWTADWDPSPMKGLALLVGPNRSGYQACYQQGGLALALTVSSGRDSQNIGNTTWVFLHHMFATEAANCGVGTGFVLVRPARSVPEPGGLAMLCVVAPALVRSARRRSRG